jgi:hypothetical protein
MSVNFHLRSGQAVRAGLFVALIAWTLIAGKDVSWDVVNHHLYLPFSWLSGRFRTDLFGAGAQSYQNPIGYFPVYGLIRAGLPSWVIGIVLGGVGALVVWPLDRICRLAWPGQETADVWHRAIALALCCIAPIFLILEGTTSSDPVTSLMVIWAVALSLEAPVDRRRAGIAGALAGLASAVKLSNLLFAFVLCLLWLLRWRLRQTDLRGTLAFGCGMLLSFAVFAGPWMWWLWTDFGNPVFPLFNNVFHSPYASQQAATMLRFVPSSPWQLVSRLWQMAGSSSFVTFEKFIPDVRPLAVFVAALLAALVLGARGGWRRVASAAIWRAPVVQLSTLLAVSYLLWMRSSGNARYALPLLILIGIPLVRAIERALPARVARIVLLTLLVVQAEMYFTLGDRRLASVDWDAGPYIDFQVPARLRDEPFLHLAVGVQSNAALAPFLAPAGALASPLGEFELPTDGPLGTRLRSLMDRWHGRTRVLFSAPDAIDPEDVAFVHRATRAWLYPLGIDVDWTDCEDIKLVASRHENRAWATDSGRRPDRERDLRSCAIVYRTDRDRAADAQRLVAERVFAIMEAACPRIFAPTPLASQHRLGGWWRHYLDTDAELSVSVYDGVTFSHFRSTKTAYFGSAEDVLNSKNPIQCPTIDYQTPQ